MRLPSPRAADSRGTHAGRPYELWLPGGPGPPRTPTGSSPPGGWPGIVIVHGADSRKETHAGFARAARARGWAAVTYDQRGNGESPEPLSPTAVEDVGRMARFLAEHDEVDAARVCARGSSMGGFMAIHAAAVSDAVKGVIALCPAGEQHLLDGVRRDRFEMRIDRDSFEPWLGEHDLRDAIALVGSKPVLLLHARGDEMIPADWTEELARHAGDATEAIIVPGGHHRSLQQDPEFHEIALRWMENALA